MAVNNAEGECAHILATDILELLSGEKPGVAIAAALAVAAAIIHDKAASLEHETQGVEAAVESLRSMVASYYKNRV